MTFGFRDPRPRFMPDCGRCAGRQAPPSSAQKRLAGSIRPTPVW